MVKKAAKKKPRRKKAAKKKRASSVNLLDKAIALLETSESPFYEGLSTLKLARKEAKEILDNANFYHHAARALSILSKRDCQIIWPDKRPCFEHGKDKSTWCEPCYALHVINGGTP